MRPIVEVNSAWEALAANILALANDRDYAMQVGIAGQKRASEYFSSRRFFRELEYALAPALAR
jgi:hypothetical protein